MRTSLVHDLDHSRFADMYAQTLVYGLFVARYNDPTPQTFNKDEARALVPKTNPFLLSFFDHIVGPNFDDRLARAVDELCEVFRISDVELLVQRHLHGAKARKDRDPIIHFYEDFLEAYDADLRKAMGAYYTPLPVVRYMVRQVNTLLRNEFQIRKGLTDASTIKYKVDDGQSRRFKDRATGRWKTVVGQELVLHKVQILDPAVGTATFLNEIIEFVHAGFGKSQRGRWPGYANADLVSNDTPYANSLVAKYKFEPGGQVKLQERKHWLHDDYLKFIAFAEDVIDRNGEGIVAMITAHGYLHNKTSRGVRWHLAKTFDKIYALDLHGNVKRKESGPGETKDENVFDIQQGATAQRL